MPAKWMTWLSATLWQMFNVSETNANRALGTGQAEHQVMSQTIDAIISHAGSGFRDLGMAKSK
jgi:hypothetical protein